MNLTFEIDGNSGFCNGVVRAVRQAENYLQFSPRLYSLGAIVHNSEELARLEAKGLEIIDIEKFGEIKNDVVLFRAHGEPPATYATAKANGIQIIDCTCPVVLKLQERILHTCEQARSCGGQIVIFGKRGHAEVNGLVGQTDGEAIVIESGAEIDSIDFSKPIYLFSQTTKDPGEYESLANMMRSRSERVTVYDTICRQVSNRHRLLAEFARSHDVVLFVSGKESSNGKVLYDLCKSNNPRSYRVESRSDVDLSWFCDGDCVGICGATSTPRWQLESLLDIKNCTLER